MRQLDLKKLLLPNLPYLLIGLYATKLGEAWRLAPGADASAKLLGLMDGFAAAFQSALPSFHPVDEVLLHGRHHDPRIIQAKENL